MDEESFPGRTRLLEAASVGRRLASTVDVDAVRADGRRRESSRRRHHRFGVVGIVAALTLTAIAIPIVRSGRSSGTGSTSLATATTSASTTAFPQTPAPIRSAAQACALVAEGAGSFFTHVESVSVVYTTNAQAGLNGTSSASSTTSTIPPGGKIWAVDVHARSINWNHSVPPDYKPPLLPSTDYRVFIEPATGDVAGRAECRCSTLLAGMGAPVILPPNC
jgi:hypothetical protein